MEGREHDRGLGYRISEKPTVQAYTTYFIEELGKYMEKRGRSLYPLPSVQKAFCDIFCEPKRMYNIEIHECEHMQWFSGEQILYSASEFKQFIEDDENAPTED